MLISFFNIGCSSQTVTEKEKVEEEKVEEENISVVDEEKADINSERIVMLEYSSLRCGEEAIEYDVENNYKYLSGSISISLDSSYLGEVGLEVFDENQKLLGYTTKVFNGSEPVYFCMDVKDAKKIAIKSSEVKEDNVILEISSLRLTTEEYGVMNAENFPEKIIAEGDLKIQDNYQRYESLFVEESLSKRSTDDYSYAEYEKGIQLLEWNNDDEIIIVPEKIEGKAVLEIADRAFEGNRKIKKVIIPASVEFIGNNAFASSSLQEVELQDGLKFIGEEAFSGCLYLKEIFFPSSLIYIGKNAFQECLSLKTAQLTPELETIGEGVFSKCENLSSEVIIPEKILIVPSEMYSDCSQITSIKLHKNIKILGAGCFNNTGIQSFQIPEGVREVENGCLENCEYLEQVTLPESLHVINEGVFSGDIRLKEIELPNSLMKIEDYAFMMCDELKELRIPKSVSEIGGSGVVFPVNITLIVYKDSYGYQYAQSIGCDFKIAK